LCSIEIGWNAHFVFSILKMRYEPTPAEQEALLQPVPTHQQPPARYQQLSVDSTPQTTYRPVRSPFVCAGCQDAIFPGLGEKLGAIVPRRKAITGYLSGFLVFVFVDIVCTRLVVLY
jgi:hypothetical protein